MNTISIISFIIATTAVAVFTYMIVRNMKKSDSATEEYFTGGRALSWYMVAGSLLLTNLSTEQLVGLNGDVFGDKIVVEEYLEGEEASFIVLTDGNKVIPFASSQDHKARDNGDLGPNTGGMGAYSPAPVVTNSVHEKILKEVIYPTVEGLNSEGSTYCGFLYAGVMVFRGEISF